MRLLRPPRRLAKPRWHLRGSAGVFAVTPGKAVEDIAVALRIPVSRATELEAAILNRVRIPDNPITITREGKPPGSKSPDPLADDIPEGDASSMSGDMPSSAKIDLIATIEPAWDEVCAYLARYPNALHTMRPDLFEQLVAEIFKSYGCSVELTSKTRDGGYDIIAIRRGPPTDLKILIEAKRFAPDRPVGVGIVRALYGVLNVTPASQLVLATTSYVTKNARREFSRVIPWQLDFYERDKILEWCRNTGAAKSTGAFPPSPGRLTLV